MVNVVYNKKLGTVRESGIELLKILGIILIVLSHVIGTLTDYVEIGVASKDPTILILGILRLSGNLGNLIFFFCSAYFLVNSTKAPTQKVLRMLVDIFVISVIWWLVLANAVGGGYYFSLEIFRRVLFPTFNGNNWYLTTYIVFCFIYPVLNIFFKTIDQKKHLLMSVGLLILYVIIGMRFDFYKTSDFFIWISFYSMIAYLKKYSKNVLDSKKINLIIWIIGVLGTVVLNLFTHYLGLKFGYKKNRMMRWNSMTNIFLVMIAFSSLNLFRQLKFKSYFINYVSGLSLLIYIIHENILFRWRVRPVIWEWILKNLDKKLLFVWIGVYLVVLFFLSTVLASFYKETLQKLIHKMSDDVHQYMSGVLNRMASKIGEKSRQSELN